MMGSIERERLLLNIELLRKSINKWSLISIGVGVDCGGEDCALCQHYEYPCVENNEKCPIYKKTGHFSCRYTPHEEWCSHMESEHNIYWKGYDQYEVQCGECKTIANRELMFLQGILEEYKEKYMEELNNSKETEDWVKEHPGTRTFVCIWRGICNASIPLCTECEEET